MKSQTQWESELLMKIHNSRIKQARVMQKSPKTRDVQRKSDIGSLRFLLKEFDLQQHFIVKFTQRLKEMIGTPEDLTRLNDSELDSLIASLKLYPGQGHKFRSMIKYITTNQFKLRSNTAVFPVISPSSLSKPRRDSIEGHRYPDQKLELNLKLKQELTKANETIANLEEMIQNSRKSIIPECKKNLTIDRNFTGKSFDSSRMRSTLHNMDMEEVCRCFSRIIENQCMKKSGKPNPVIKEFSCVFEEENSDEPSETHVYNWCRNIFSKGKLEKEVIVNAIVYLERYVEKSQVNVSVDTWKKLVFTSIFLAAKSGGVNKGLYEVYSVEEIERMERSMLILIEHNLNIMQSEYAHAYFLMRTYASAKDKSAPIKILPLDKVLDLQKGVTNEKMLKQAFLKSM